MLNEILQAPGQVQIDNLVLVSFNKGTYVSLTDYLVEINLYESIFENSISGEIILADSRNLIQELGIIREEYLSVSFRTTTLSKEKSISKMFKIYALNDKEYAKDGSVLIYKLNFTSVESFQDIINPIYRAFNGSPNDIVKLIFDEYISSIRNISIGESTTGSEEIKSSVAIFGNPANIINFVSPGWSPIKCINWIASKSVPSNNKAANFLFWETTKGFYFGNIGELIQKADSLSIGTYDYSSPKIKSPTQEDIEKNKFMFTIRSISVNSTFDQMRNLTTGYTSSRLVDINLYNKEYNHVDYDHGDKFNNYPHLQTEMPNPFFDKATPRNPSTFLDVNYSYPALHTGNLENFDVKLKDIFGNRRSNILELRNFNMEITIPGRTDIEVGRTININLPKGIPGDIAKPMDYKDDGIYSGNYLITSLCHKINLKSHYIIMEVSKDSLPQRAIKQ